MVSYVFSREKNFYLLPLLGRTVDSAVAQDLNNRKYADLVPKSLNLGFTKFVAAIDA
jgi:hypothetical protein